MTYRLQCLRNCTDLFYIVLVSRKITFEPFIKSGNKSEIVEARKSLRENDEMRAFLSRICFYGEMQKDH